MGCISRIPERFPTAQNIHHECDPYQLQAVVRAYGSNAPATHLLYASAKHRLRDWSLPWNMPRILKRYGIRAHWSFWARPFFPARLMQNMRADRPTLFVIRSMQTQRLHWISAWGYDETTDEFLCYDSQKPEAFEVCGNVRYGASLLKNHLPWHGTFAVTINS